MGGGNAQKSATARARNEAKKAKAGKGSQLAVNKAAQSIICQVGKLLYSSSTRGMALGCPVSLSVNIPSKTFRPYCM